MYDCMYYMISVVSGECFNWNGGVSVEIVSTRWEVVMKLVGDLVLYLHFSSLVSNMHKTTCAL